jgi:hypothetical protein
MEEYAFSPLGDMVIGVKGKWCLERWDEIFGVKFEVGFLPDGAIRR